MRTNAGDACLTSSISQVRGEPLFWAMLRFFFRKLFERNGMERVDWRLPRERPNFLSATESTIQDFLEYKALKSAVANCFTWFKDACALFPVRIAFRWLVPTPMLQEFTYRPYIDDVNPFWHLINPDHVQGNLVSCVFCMNECGPSQGIVVTKT